MASTNILFKFLFDVKTGQSDTRENLVVKDTSGYCI